MPWRGRPRAPTGEIPRPCRAKRNSRARFLNPGEGDPGGLQARSLGPAERKRTPEQDPSALARVTQGAYRRDPSALPSEKELQSEIPQPWRGRPRGPTGEIPRPCRAKRTLAKAPQGAYRRDPSALPSEKELQSEIPRPWRGFRPRVPPRIQKLPKYQAPGSSFPGISRYI